MQPGESSSRTGSPGALLMDSREENRRVAVENSALADSHGVLQPLLSLSTGEVIACFPSSVQEVNSLPCRYCTVCPLYGRLLWLTHQSLAAAEVNRILVELKIDTDGNVRQRRRRLLAACGVTHRTS